jgi:hypothetical protein
MAAPFTDAAMPEVVARVAFRLVQLEYRKQTNTPRSGVETVIDTLTDVECFRGSLCHSALLAALFACRQGKRLATWRDTAVFLSRAGYGFRRCWYEEYKGNRRDPRVTNRGVR